MSVTAPERHDDEVCAVPECPAIREAGLATCQPHRDAVLAKAAFSVGKHCAACKRTIRKEDYVYRNIPTQHVRCEPVAPRQTREALCESEKPLFPKELA